MKKSILAAAIILSTSTAFAAKTTESTGFGAKIGNWQVMVTTDKFDNTPVAYYAYTQDSEGAMLVVKCGDKVEAQPTGILPSLGSLWAEKPIDVKIKFNKGKTQKFSGKYPRTLATSKALVDNIMSASSVKIKTTQGNESHFFEFGLVGSTKAITKVRNSCAKIGK
jgi:hypothetical protein